MSIITDLSFSPGGKLQLRHLEEGSYHYSPGSAALTR